MKYKFDYTTQFKKDYCKLINQNVINEIDTIINRLLNGEQFEEKYEDRPLKGNYKGCCGCHIRPDLVLIYKKDKDIMVLTALRLGSHSEVF